MIKTSEMRTVNIIYISLRLMEGKMGRGNNVKRGIPQIWLVREVLCNQVVVSNAVIVFLLFYQLP